MARSIFAVLHRRFGDPLAGAELRRRTAERFERVGEAPSVDFSAALRPGGVKPKLAIIGAGFAGCMAAYLTKAGMDVRIFDPLDRAGGRVWSSLPSSQEPVVPGRIVEKGAELIGLNHHGGSCLQRRSDSASPSSHRKSYRAAGGRKAASN
jgi:hypothetical protein